MSLSLKATYELSFNTGPPLMSTSNRCTFWYRCTISPFSLIHMRVFFTLPSWAGSWIPTFICSSACRASLWRPKTNSLSCTDRASDTDSAAEEPM